MRRFVVLSLIVALAGCGPSLQEREAAMNRFIGQPEAVLVQQMGVPSRTYEAGGVKFLAYDERRLDYAPGFYGGGPWGYPGWYGYGYATFPPTTVERICETTFEVVGSVVQRVSLRGNACGY